MRILIVGINYYPEPTGIGKYTGEMSEWLAARGHEVRVVAAPPYYPFWKIGTGYHSFRYKIENINGVVVYRCPLWVPRRVTGCTRILHLASFALSSIPMLIAHRNWRPNVIINVAPTVFTAPMALLFAKLTGAGSWLHFHDFELELATALGMIKVPTFRKFAKKFEQSIMKRFDKVSTISNRMVEKLKEKGVDDSKIVFLPNWVNAKTIYPRNRSNQFRNMLGISSDTLLALYSGNMGKKQGLDAIVRCAQNLSDNKKIQFLLCGEGMDRSRIEVLARNLPNVFLIPLQPTEKLNELLNAADIHLLPQGKDAEGLVMPSKLYGMLASGKPVIATVQLDSEIAKIIKNCGVIVPPGNSSELTKAIVSLSRDKDTRFKLGTEARRIAMKQFDKENLLSGLEASLYSFLAN